MVDRGKLESEAILVPESESVETLNHSPTPKVMVRGQSGPLRSSLPLSMQQENFYLTSVAVTIYSNSYICIPHYSDL